MVNELRAPAGLAAAGRQLHRKVAREVADAGLALTSTEEQFLLSACELADQLAVLKAAMAEQPLWVKGSMGQLVPNGMLQEIRQYNALINLTLSRIRLDLSDADAGADSDLIRINRPNPQRAGALKRWHGAGA
jgi:hypothetical protein